MSHTYFGDQWNNALDKLQHLQQIETVETEEELAKPADPEKPPKTLDLPKEQAYEHCAFLYVRYVQVMSHFFYHTKQTIQTL